MSIIKQIYEGNLVMPETEYPDDSEYLIMRKELGEKQKQLNSQLDENGRKLLDEILSLRVNMDSVNEWRGFLFGFKIGANIMLEVLSE